MGKHHASEGRASVKIAPRKCITTLLKPRKNHASMPVFEHFLERFCSQNFLRLYTASGACSCSCPNRKAHVPDGKTEVRGSVKVAHKNSLTSLLRPRKNHACNMLAFLDFKEVLLTKPLWVAPVPVLARIEKHTCWMGKLKIAPKNSLTSLPKPRKNVLFCLFFSYTWNLRNSNRNSYIPAAAGGNAW